MGSEVDITEKVDIVKKTDRVKVILISIIVFLVVCLIASGITIGALILQPFSDAQSAVKDILTTHPDLMTADEAAKFLKLSSKDDLENLVKYQHSSQKSLNPVAGTGTVFIKTIDINGTKWYSKKNLIEWVEDHLTDDGGI